MTKTPAPRDPQPNRTKAASQRAPVRKSGKYVPAVLHANASFSQEPDRSQIIWNVD